MSRQSIAKPQMVDMCDWCDKEITDTDKHAGGVDRNSWAHIVRKYVSLETDDPKVSKFTFLWEKKYPEKTVEYDFHVQCFDKMYKVAKKAQEKDV